MSSNANKSLVITTTCVHCVQPIELVLLTSQETGNEFLFWRHVVNGLYTCDVSANLVPFNMAEPNWQENPMRYQGFQSTDCAGGCCYNANKDECVNADCTCHTWQ